MAAKKKKKKKYRLFWFFAKMQLVLLLAIIAGACWYYFGGYAEEVKDYIFGYTIMNDVSAREVQTEHKQWYFGKSLDGFTPIGPWIVTRDEFEWMPKLGIRSYVNGELRQNNNTELMMTGIDTAIHQLSQGITLKAGTIIAMGTPSGVGMAFDPPRCLNSGDVVRCEIEGIGVLENTVR